MVSVDCIRPDFGPDCVGLAPPNVQAAHHQDALLAALVDFKTALICVQQRRAELRALGLAEENLSQSARRQLLAVDAAQAALR